MLSRSHRRGSRNRGGFTLIEVVVASAIMMLVFAAMLGIVSYARRTASLTENRLACLHIARQTMEHLIAQSYTATDNAVGTTQLPNSRGSYTITQDSDGKTKNITVVINWVEPTGGQQSVSLTTSLSKSLHK